MNAKPKKVRVNDTRGFNHPATGAHTYVAFDKELTVKQVPHNEILELSRYEVRDGETLVGYVYSYEGRSYRKAGRLITRTFSPTQWKYHLSNGDQFNHVSARARRVDAIIDLLFEVHIKSLTPSTPRG